MAILVAFVRFPGGFRLDRMEQEGKSDFVLFNILCEQPFGTLATAMLESEDVITGEDAQNYLSADDISYYMALAEQQAKRET